MFAALPFPGSGESQLGGSVDGNPVGNSAPDEAKRPSRQFCALPLDLPDTPVEQHPNGTCPDTPESEIWQNVSQSQTPLEKPEKRSALHIPGKYADTAERPVARNLQILELELSSDNDVDAKKVQSNEVPPGKSGVPSNLSSGTRRLPNLTLDTPSGSTAHSTQSAIRFASPAHLTSTVPAALGKSMQFGYTISTPPSPSPPRRAARRKTAPVSKPVALDIRAVESPEDVQLIHRISVMLSNPAARTKVCMMAFDKFSAAVESPGQAVEMQLPVEKLAEALVDLKIPNKHAAIFRSVLRKMSPNRKLSMLTYEQFLELLVKSLRRIRDQYCTRLSKDNFVTRKQRQMEDEYMQLAPCGSGSFGQCSWVVHKVTRKIRVIKKIPKERLEMPKEEIEQELDTLARLDHPHVVRLFEWFENSTSFFLVLEAAHGGDLDKLLRQAKEDGRPGLMESTIKILMAQALGALVYIHSQGVIHRDLKPANMILADDKLVTPTLLLADFGIADIFGSGELSSGHAVASQKKGTWAYMAPEIFNDVVSPKSDLWALGVVLFELFTGTKPFGQNPFEVHTVLCYDEGEVDVSPVEEVGASVEAVIFLKRLLSKNDSERPSAKDAEEELKEWVDGGEASERPDPEVALARVRRSVRPSLTRSMTGFKERSTFSKMALLCIASQLDTSMLEDLNEMFSVLDKDHDGQLSAPEFIDGFRQLGVKEDDIEAMIDSMDINCSGHVEYSEFIAGCLGARTELIDTTLFHAFNVFDINHDGVITLEEMRTILGQDGTYMGLLPDGKSLEDEFAAIDTSQDGGISYREFRAYLEKEQQEGEKQTTALSTLLAENVRRASDAKQPSSPSLSSGSSSSSNASIPPATSLDMFGNRGSKSAVSNKSSLKKLVSRVEEVLHHQRTALSDCAAAMDGWIDKLSHIQTARLASNAGKPPAG